MPFAHPAVPVLHRSWALDLTTVTLYALLRLRVEVFVVEQACAYAELDGWDLHRSTRHYWLAPDAHPDAPVALLRLLEQAEGEFRIGRLCTARGARGQGLARRLMEAALAEVGTATCLLDSQVHLADFYVAFGFVRAGEPYDWGGVAHLPMRRG